MYPRPRAACESAKGKSRSTTNLKGKERLLLFRINPAPWSSAITSAYISLKLNPGICAISLSVQRH